MEFSDSRGSRMSSLLLLYDCKAKSVQIDQQAFWKIDNTCGKTNQEMKFSFEVLILALLLILVMHPRRKELEEHQATNTITCPLSRSKKYNKDSSLGEKKQNSTVDKWILSPPKDKATDSSVKTRILAYGNASFGTSIKCLSS
ncbi:hypothetical protein [Parasitella parasitica]|uniref:Uncharacterized protein n=1 Tax=Parasitella parasitica TaxID=35722 RepID=A0A0B7NL25_9FUNG|nr:hypothetical protein [Parasitella parasitica]